MEREAATREAAEEVSRAADAVRAENESLAAALAEERAEKARLAAETVAARGGGGLGFPRGGCGG